MSAALQPQLDALELELETAKGHRREVVIRDVQRIRAHLGSYAGPLSIAERSARDEIANLLDHYYEAKERDLGALQEAIRRVRALRSLYPRAWAALPAAVWKREEYLGDLLPKPAVDKRQMTLGGSR